MMSLIQQYNDAIAAGSAEDDALQRNVLYVLEDLTSALENRKRFLWFRRRQKNSIKGVYLHGPVGAGKTFLMDLFYQNVNESKKSRYHFHQFMQQIDAQLRQMQGQPDPIRSIAKQIVKKNRLLCLDEFLVQDIATAMVLTELFTYLFSHGIVLVITSNTAPDHLYWEGLQRVRFLPVIALLKQHCEVIDILESRDYRLGRTPLAKAYLYPLNHETQDIMAAQFQSLSAGNKIETPLWVQQREIPFVKRKEQAVWFTFAMICHIPRSQLDYLELASRFHTIFVSDIPPLTKDDTVCALLFTNFIDVMYDNRVHVIISAAVPIDALYCEGEVADAFQRTRSRLHEMQSVGYCN